MQRPLPDYEIMIAAINHIDEVVWVSLWGNINPNWIVPPCPRPRQPPVRCGRIRKEMAETYANVVEKALKRHGYHVVPAIVPASHRAQA